MVSIVLLFAIFGMLPGCRADAGSDFKIQKGVLTKYVGKSEKVVIPSSVTSIGANAFQKCNTVKTVVIPSSVKKIGEQAFLDCTKLSSITIPKSVTSIGDQAFDGCYNLKEINGLGSI